MDQIADQEPSFPLVRFKCHNVALYIAHIVASSMPRYILHVVVPQHQGQLVLHVMHILPMCKTNLNKINNLVLLHTTFARVKCAKV